LQSHYWRTNCYSATQQSTSILWNPNICYSCHNTSFLTNMLSHTNPFHIHPKIYSRSVWIVSYRVPLSLPSSLLSSEFSVRIMYLFIFSPMSDTCAAYFIILDLKIRCYLESSTPCKSPHYAIFWKFIWLLPSYIQIFSSALCSHKASLVRNLIFIGISIFTYKTFVGRGCSVASTTNSHGC
jgi:hypothetical protein